MLNSRPFPTVELLIESSDAYQGFSEFIPLTLSKILPETLFATKGRSSYDFEDQRNQFQEILPYFTHSGFKSVPHNLSFYMVGRYRPNAFKFFFEMISGWLVPGKRLNVVMLHAVDFRMPQLGPDLYTLSEVIIRLDNESDAQQLRQNLPIIGTEIRLGIDSAYYARKILEVKGLTADEKTAMIQEHAAYLIDRMPESFDNDLLNEMQHVLVKCPDEFKAERESRLMSRIISVHYLFRKLLVSAVKASPHKRHLLVKLTKSRLKRNGKVKTVLGVLVGVNFLKYGELFEERHLLKAISTYVPNVNAIEHSFFQNTRGNEDICTLYLEVEKSDGSNFTLEEIRKLRRELPIDLKDRIESLIHPIFMPRNEEEIMRNILSLSSQIKYLRDIPQVVITFDEQADRHLFFTVILVRILRAKDHSVQKMFQDSDTTMEYLSDRVKTIGYIRKRYPKEAVVFRVKIKKDRFLRKDHSIDLYRARRYVVDELSRIMGEFRDFNGGMISKQNELLSQVKSLLVSSGKYHDMLLENLFYSLQPATMRSVLEPTPLKILCQMLFEVVDARFFEIVRTSIKTRDEGNYFIVMIASDEPFMKDRVNRELAKLAIAPNDLATAYVTVSDTPCLGYIFRCDQAERRRQFLQAIEQVVGDLALECV
jgi:hypothetical protein